MKNTMLISFLVSFLYSCGFSLQEDRYDFNNFKDTPIWDLAKAVRDDNRAEIKEILKGNKLEIDFKDPKYQQTLLVLSIENNKKDAFLALLEFGSNPNELVGELKDETPFIKAIWDTENCDLFYIGAMLKHGANPNLEIKNPNPGHYFQNSYPLLAAILKNDNRANDCMDLIKLLVDNGADINCCYKQPPSYLCEGVITKSLASNSMEALRYFVIEKKINIPDTVIIYGGANKSKQKAYGLKEALNSKYFTYDDFESEGRKIDRSRQREIRYEILEYLDKRPEEK